MIKQDRNYQVEQYHARLVVTIYAQKERIDFNEIFSQVIHFITLRVVLAKNNDHSQSNQHSSGEAQKERKAIRVSN